MLYLIKLKQIKSNVKITWNNDFISMFNIRGG